LALPDEQARSRFLARSHFRAHTRFLIRSGFFACACLLPLVLGAGQCTIASGRQRQHVDVRDAHSGIEVSPK
jgi:hypothetical protein